MSVESDRLNSAVVSNDAETATELLADTWSKRGSCAVHQLVKDAYASAIRGWATSQRTDYSIVLDPVARKETVTVYHQTFGNGGYVIPIAGIVETPCKK